VAFAKPKSALTPLAAGLWIGAASSAGLDAPPDYASAFGHGRLGLTLAATTGALVTGHVAGHAPPFDLVPLSVGRL